ncbi:MULTISPECIES: hypothetical protein [unclassified Paenibacillus]|uniref:Uncharacterized protein n=1 Tax=Paenibacillus provencensis TaxID=441151 RepID=A0ABW3QH85_9BACL|nr:MULTISPECIES: hypothetical protein [unclassified Paenibacillus]MCM3130144.1 hypothetical protein [Paenibacillus sp. MER 78]SDX70464.1 hypothetical protein SAMN05518848_11232 [Paenibacillus sp. PDC88]SFS88120.1 hypothetical protein SAMN04488601_10628 [Paenibacillus sp. 453mf]
MILKKVMMTWDQILELPKPLLFGKGSVRANRFDPTRVYLEFSSVEVVNMRNLYRQIKIWLKNARCVSIQFTYEGDLPTKELKRLRFSRSADKIWRSPHENLSIAAIPVVNAGTWILSVENRKDKLGVPVDASDLSSLFSFQLSIDVEGEVISS